MIISDGGGISFCRHGGGGACLPKEGLSMRTATRYYGSLSESVVG